jgi:predicted ArsR family transcriptional regulator
MTLPFRELYPVAAGFKESTTSQDAAIATDARGLRAVVVTCLKQYGPMTADECAARLGLSILSVRPRFSELRMRHQIRDTGERRLNVSGHRAKVWAVLAVDPAGTPQEAA